MEAEQTEFSNLPVMWVRAMKDSKIPELPCISDWEDEVPPPLD